MDPIREAAERLLNEAKLHRADYTAGSDFPELVEDIETVANAALAARASDRDEVARLRSAFTEVAEGYHAAHQIEDRRLSASGAVEIDECTDARCALASAALAGPAERREEVGP